MIFKCLRSVWSGGNVLMLVGRRFSKLREGLHSSLPGLAMSLAGESNACAPTNRVFLESSRDSHVFRRLLFATATAAACAQSAAEPAAGRREDAAV